MTIAAAVPRPLGTMVAYGFADGRPRRRAVDWRVGSGPRSWRSSPTGGSCPTLGALRDRVADAGLAIHSAHGCWGGQTIRAARVDLGQPDPGDAPRRRSTT